MLSQIFWIAAFWGIRNDGSAPSQKLAHNPVHLASAAGQSVQGAGCLERGRLAVDHAMSFKILQALGEQVRDDARQSTFQTCESKPAGDEKFAHDEEIPAVSHDVQWARHRAQPSVGLYACIIISLDKRRQSLQIRSEPVIKGATVTATVSASAPAAVLQEYYRILTAGAEACGAGQGLRVLLSDHLDFTGSLAGHHLDATGGFLHGVAGFISTVRSIGVIRDVHDERVSAVLYDADMPGGAVRFAEFFTFSDGVIDTLDLHYDGQDYLAEGGQ